MPFNPLSTGSATSKDVADYVSSALAGGNVSTGGGVGVTGSTLVRFPFTFATPGLNSSGVSIGYTTKPGDFVQFAFIKVDTAFTGLSGYLAVVYAQGEVAANSQLAQSGLSAADTITSGVRRISNILTPSNTIVSFVAAAPLMLMMTGTGTPAGGIATLIMYIGNTG